MAAGDSMKDGPAAGRTAAGAEELLGLFPPGTSQDDDGMLVVGGCRLDDLAAEHGTPVQVVDEAAIRRRARDYREELATRWPDSQVVFASKAFPCTAVQRLMVSERLWLDVAGGGEIIAALGAGADPATLVLHGNAKTTEEIELAVSSGLGVVVIDNLDDIERLEAAVPAGRQQDCLIRVIPGVQATTYAAQATGHEGSKFGLLPAAAVEAVARVEASERLQMLGLHTHVGSQILDASELAAAVAPLAALGEYPVYDLGGGLGARYTYCDHPPSVAEYLDVLMDAARANLPAGARVLIEPGRSMVASAGITVYTVTTIKPGSTTFVAVDGGMADNMEIALVGQRFEATIADRVGGGKPVTVVGRHCESGDVLSADVPLRNPHVGDLLAIPVTGAYCYTMANNYNGARRIPVVFADSGGARLVVRRETWEELLVRDVPLD
jgi:diaminopimelate decarboxylase